MKSDCDSQVMKALLVLLPVGKHLYGWQVMEGRKTYKWFHMLYSQSKGYCFERGEGSSRYDRNRVVGELRWMEWGEISEEFVSDNDML